MRLFGEQVSLTVASKLSNQCNSSGAKVLLNLFKQTEKLLGGFLPYLSVDALGFLVAIVGVPLSDGVLDGPVGPGVTAGLFGQFVVYLGQHVQGLGLLLLTVAHSFGFLPQDGRLFHRFLG